MCDYSLECYETRDATAEDQLVTTRFPSGSIGCISKDDHAIGSMRATCLKPGMKLRLAGIRPEILDRLKAGGVENPEVVEFAKLPDYHLHQDGFKFDSGFLVPIQALGAGVIVTVLPAEVKPKELPASLTNLLAKVKQVLVPGE